MSTPMCDVTLATVYVVSTPAQDLHIFTCKIVWDHPPEQLMQHLVCKTKEFQTVRKCLSEAYLHAHHSHQGLILTAVSIRYWPEWATTHLRWRLAQAFSSQVNPGLLCTWQMAEGIFANLCALALYHLHCSRIWVVKSLWLEEQGWLEETGQLYQFFVLMWLFKKLLNYLNIV